MYARTLSVVLCLIPISTAYPSLSQSTPTDPATIDASQSISSNSEAAVPSEANDNSHAISPADPPASAAPESSSQLLLNLDGPKSDPDSKIEPVVEKAPRTKPPDFNRSIFYRNKLEFSLDVGWLPINIPFPFDFMLGDDYNTYPLKYTLVPVIASLRWQLGGLSGPLFLRGNWDLEISGAVVAIPRGPETRYFSYIMGMRRNFVPRNWRVTPYIDWRAGLGNIDAKGPLGVPYAQGQDFTFTLNLGSGLRYNFSPRCAATLGLNWMHISNANMSQGPPGNWGVRNYGINVYGPVVGIDIQLRRHHRTSTPQ